MGLQWIILFFFWAPVGQTKALRVSIDPGHGGRDQGAIHGQTRESDINLNIAHRLYKRLKRDPDFEALLLRKTDRDLKLPTRLKMSRQFGSDLFISIHANAHKNKKVHGSELYIQQPQTYKRLSLISHDRKRQQRKVFQKKSLGNANQSPSPSPFFQKKNRGNKEVGNGARGDMGTDVENIVFDLRESGRLLQSYQLGSLVRRHWRQNKKRRIRQAPLYVLSQNSAPAILIEVGYITNEQERRKLTQAKVQKAIAQKIHAALEDYVKNMDKLTRGI